MALTHNQQNTQLTGVPHPVWTYIQIDILLLDVCWLKTDTFDSDGQTHIRNGLASSQKR